MNKRDLVSKIKKLKGKVAVGNKIKNLCDQVSPLSKNLAKFMDSNEKLSSLFIVPKNIDTSLEKCITGLEKSLPSTGI